MKPKFAVHIVSLGLLMLATTGAAANAAPGPQDPHGFAQVDTSAAKPDTVVAAPDTAMKAPVTPAPAAAPAVAPATQTPPPAAAPPPATPAPAAAAPAKQSAPNDKIYYGGTVTLSFGTSQRIGIFPMIGYKLTEKISGGAEIGYEYVSYNSSQSTHNYGGSVFGRFRVGRALYAHAEYQNMNFEIFNGNGTSDREWVPAFLLGGGFVKPLGPRTSAYAEVLFDVMQADHSPYGWEPIINFGVCVGF
jgi:hypothetical protein